MFYSLITAFNIFGAAGKMAIEVFMIGFLGGTCIAFFVVMGDLAPPIISEHLGISNTERLRVGILLGNMHMSLCGHTRTRFTVLSPILPDISLLSNI